MRKQLRKIHTYLGIGMLIFEFVICRLVTPDWLQGLMCVGVFGAYVWLAFRLDALINQLPNE